MRKRAVAASVVSSVAVLVTAWQLGNLGATDGILPGRAASVSSGTGGSPSNTAAPSPSSTAPTDTPTPALPPAGVSGTFVGSEASTRFGTVQVQITVADNTITDVTALKLTDADRRSVSISNRAAPILRSEVLVAQSADVNVVSGATYTSDGYLQSLQAAIDQAGL